MGQPSFKGERTERGKPPLPPALGVTPCCVYPHTLGVTPNRIQTTPKVEKEARKRGEKGRRESARGQGGEKRERVRARRKRMCERERVRARERGRVRKANASPRLSAREPAARTHARHATGQPEPVSSPQIGAGPQPKPRRRSWWAWVRSLAIKRMAPARPPPQEPLSAPAACLAVLSLETLTGTPPAVLRCLPWAAAVCVCAHTTISTP